MGVSVVFDGVGRSFGTTTALTRVDLSLAPGSFTAIVGPSGCGKSSLLNIAAGLDRDHSGETLIDGTRVLGPRKKTGFIFQDAALLPWRTVLDNAAFALEANRVPKERRRQVAIDMLRRVGLADFSQHYPHQLSGGMRQRAAIARVLSTEPNLILADEPFGALDEQTRTILGFELLRIAHQNDATVIFVTHSIQEAVLLSDRVIVLSARPGEVRLDLSIDLPAQRDPTLLGEKQAAQYVEKIWKIIKVESESALAQQAAAA